MTSFDDWLAELASAGKGGSALDTIDIPVAIRGEAWRWLFQIGGDWTGFGFGGTPDIFAHGGTQTGLISYTGAAANLTLPTGTALDTGFAQLATNTAIDFAVINTGSGTATMVVNTGVTSLGALAVAAGASGQFRLRKTGTATYVLYRLS